MPSLFGLSLMKSRNFYLFIIAMSVFLLLSGCSTKVKKPDIEKPDPLVLLQASEIPLLADDLRQEPLELAIGRSLQYYNRVPENREYRFGKRIYTAGELKKSLLEFLDIVRAPWPDEAKRNAILENFDVYRSTGRNGGSVLFTGYYEPIIPGSLEKTPKYGYPIYKTPDDHIVIKLGKFNKKYKNERIIGRADKSEIIPYYTREEIDSDGCLEGRGLELFWLSDPVDIFFLQIQGSGTIKLTNGDLVQVSYAQSNGHPYRSIGRLLADLGKIPMEKMSLSNIRKYLREHPEEMSDILGYNKSYVFFRVVDKGPVGSLNVPITSGRSIATDLSLFPRGALAFIRLKKPVVEKDGRITSWVDFSRFVLNQDTGGAIKGPGRVDLFCGKGAHAGVMAGHLKEEGELYFLVRKKDR